ncbi:MAG: transglycosylase SLT domain-containing protein [Pseudomonadota bacterium]
MPRTKVVFLALFAFFLASLSVVSYADQKLEADRAKFKQAWQLVKSGRISAAKQSIKALESYPLYVYLRAAELRPKLQKPDNPPLEKFLADFEGTYPAESLRTDWLAWLATIKRWDVFLRFYRPQNDIALQCHHKTALLNTKQFDGLFRSILPLWTIGKSQPSACNPAFSFFETHEAFDDPIIWQRFRAAMNNNQPGLARYVAKKFSNSSAQTWSARWLEAHTNPHRVLSKSYLLEKDLIAKDVLFHALAKLARANFSAAEKHWVRISAAGELTPSDVNQGHKILAIAAGKAEDKNQIFYLDQVENSFADGTLESLRMRRGIQLRAWPELNRWTSGAPVDPKTSRLRWKYWHARSAELIDKNTEATKGFSVLASERDYYGFVAADKLGQAYQFNDRPIKPAESELLAFKAKPEIRRAQEFFELGMQIDANRQWRWAIRNFGKSDLETAALIASGWGWHNRAIATLGKARSYDDVNIRFPVIHQDAIAKNAKKRGLEDAVIFAIIRTESAFHAGARSSAGALGLMQLMPATGREAGRRIGLKIKKSSQLLAPSTNIAIGSSYLSSLINKYNGSFPMAAAAYNAGPHRVRQWRPKSNCIAADIWIDSIPFRETRRYVRTALFYYAVYQHRLGLDINRLQNLMQSIRPRNDVACTN